MRPGAVTARRCGDDAGSEATFAVASDVLTNRVPSGIVATSASPTHSATRTRRYSLESEASFMAGKPR